MSHSESNIVELIYFKNKVYQMKLNLNIWIVKYHKYLFIHHYYSCKQTLTHETNAS